MNDTAENDAPGIIAAALDEWLFRMHGITSSCDHATEAQGILDALAEANYRVMRTVQGATRPNA